MNAILRRVAFGVLAAVLAPLPSAAQTPAANHWGTWAGCWRLINESGAVIGADRPTVCVVEIADGARLTTTVDGRVALERTIVADGTSRPVDDGDCRGSERYDWAANGLRVYSRSEVTCTSSPGLRRMSGYSLLLRDGTWLDVQAVEVNLNESVRIRRYRRVDSDVSARPAPGQALDIADVKEASARLAPAAVEAAIAESPAAIRLSSKRLIELDEAGVPGRIIDLLVATAYPERFVVDRGSSDRVSVLPGVFYAYPYYYSPFAYSPYGWWNPYYDGGGVIIIGPPATPVPPPVASGTGRAVDGRGYTQVRPRPEVEPLSPGRTNPGPSSASSASAPASSGSDSSSSSVSSSGFSSGGGGDGGRTAVPR